MQQEVWPSGKQRYYNRWGKPKNDSLGKGWARARYEERRMIPETNNMPRRRTLISLHGHDRQESVVDYLDTHGTWARRWKPSNMEAEFEGEARVSRERARG